MKIWTPEICITKHAHKHLRCDVLDCRFACTLRRDRLPMEGHLVAINLLSLILDVTFFTATIPVIVFVYLSTFVLVKVLEKVFKLLHREKLFPTILAQCDKLLQAVDQLMPEFKRRKVYFIRSLKSKSVQKQQRTVVNMLEDGLPKDIVNELLSFVPEYSTTKDAHEQTREDDWTVYTPQRILLSFVERISEGSFIWP